MEVFSQLTFFTCNSNQEEDLVLTIILSPWEADVVPNLSFASTSLICDVDKSRESWVQNALC